jgi:hypothetical protein
MNTGQLANLLNRDEVRGRVLRDFAHIDVEMDTVITFYFTTNRRYEPFTDLILSRLGPNDKITILERLKYRKKYRSLRALPLIRKIQQARNYIAHQTYVHHADGKLKNANWADLFSDYPRSYERAVLSAREGLGRLCRTNELLDHFAPNRRNYDWKTGAFHRPIDSEFQKKALGS